MKLQHTDKWFVTEYYSALMGKQVALISVHLSPTVRWTHIAVVCTHVGAHIFGNLPERTQYAPSLLSLFNYKGSQLHDGLEANK